MVEFQFQFQVSQGFLEQEAKEALQEAKEALVQVLVVATRNMDRLEVLFHPGHHQVF